MTCQYNCNTNTCPFVQDPHKHSRYICLKCGLERDIGHFNFGAFLVFSSIIVIVITMLSSCAGLEEVSEKELLNQLQHTDEQFIV